MISATIICRATNTFPHEEISDEIQPDYFDRYIEMVQRMTRRQYRFESSAYTRKGTNHTVNQDAHGVDDNVPFYVLSDGLGSTAGAEEASRIVCEEMSQRCAVVWPENIAHIRTGLGRAVQALAARLRDEGAADITRRSMSATLTSVVAIGANAWITHLGDSRAYLWRHGQLTQVTGDHTLAWAQFELDAISKEEIRTHPNQRLHTRTLGARSSLSVAEIDCHELQVGDWWLLCSDGVNKSLDDIDIAELLLRAKTLDDASKRIVIGAYDAGSTDDITVVLVEVL